MTTIITLIFIGLYPLVLSIIMFNLCIACVVAMFFVFFCYVIILIILTIM